MTRTPAAPSQPSRSATGYSPHVRTALVLTGTGTAGAYHAGVLRALHEAGVKIDLSKITIPIYVMGAREDHIAPWRSTYAARALFGGPVRFVLAGSGHIAGVVNPPEPGKYPHWTNSHEAKDPEVWLSKAQKHDGSWWPDWCKWNARHAGAMVPARVPGTGALPALAPAPGTYVLEKAR